MGFKYAALSPVLRVQVPFPYSPLLIFFAKRELRHLLAEIVESVKLSSLTSKIGNIIFLFSPKKIRKFKNLENLDIFDYLYQRQTIFYRRAKELKYWKYFPQNQ